MIRILTVSFSITLANRPTPEAKTPDVSMNAERRALLKSHCYKCHDADKRKGRVRSDDLPFTLSDTQTAERWQKILNALNSGEMPSEDEK